jgi:hypothetical protein
MTDPASAQHQQQGCLLACIHRGNNVVRKVDLTSGDYTVTTIAGSVGPSDFADGKAYSPALSTDSPDKCLQHIDTVMYNAVLFQVLGLQHASTSLQAVW